MGDKVEEMSYEEQDLEKLKYAFPGLNSFFLALVWEFAEFLLRLQTSIEEWEQAKKD